MKEKNVAQVKVLSGSTSSEQEVRGLMLAQFRETPVAENELLYKLELLR